MGFGLVCIVASGNRKPKIGNRKQQKTKIGTETKALLNTRK